MATMLRRPGPTHRLVVSGLLLVAASAAAQEPAAPRILKAGAKASGRIDADTPTFAHRTLAGGPHRSAAWRLEDLGDGVVTIDVQSLDFATCLQLVDDQGKLLAQDEGGAGAGASRLVIRGTMGAGMTLLVIGLRDPDGDYEIELRAGAPPAADPARVVERARATLARQEARHGADSLPAAERSLWLARALRSADRAAEALPCIQRALETRQGLDAGPEAMGECQRELGLTHAQLADHEKALAAFLDCRATFDATFGNTHRALPVVMLDIAQQQDALGDPEAAIASLREGIRLFDRQRNPDLPARAMLAIRLIALLEARGDRAGAAVEARAAVAGPLGAKPTSLRLADIQLTLTAKLVDCGELPAARQLFELCAPHLRTGLPPTHRRRVEIAFFGGVLADAESRLEGVRAAVAELQELLARPGMSLPWDADSTACSIAELELLVEPAAAVARLQPHLARVEATKPASALHTRMLGLILSGLVRSGNAAAAVERLEAALDPTSPFATASHQDRDRLLAAGAEALADIRPQLALRCARELVDDEQPWPSMAASTRLDFLATCHMRCGDGRAAVQTAMAAATMALAVFERDLPDLPDDRALQLYAALRPTLDLVLGFLRQSTTAKDAEPVYSLVRGFQGRVLRGEVGDRRRARELHAGPTLALLDRLRTIDATLDGAATPAQRPGLLEQRAQIEVDLARLAGANPAHRAPDLATLQSHLGNDEAFVDYVVWMRRVRGPGDPDGSPPHLAAFVVRKTGPVRVAWLGPTEPIHASLDNVLRVAGRRLRADPTGRALETKALRQLADAVWAPLAELIGDARRVTIATDGVAAMVPFVALPGRTPDRFLIEDLELAMVTSSADIVATPRPASPPSLLLVGDVDFGPGARFAPLPGTVQELADIAATVAALPGDAATATVLRGREATTNAVLQAIPGRTHVHLATHGLFGEAPATAPPLRGTRSAATLAAASLAAAQVRASAGTGVALVDANIDDTGILRATPLSWIDLQRCELIVLSACETGLGKPFAGEQLLGLRRAMRLAGAARTMTTLWRVEDRRSAQLIAMFYRALWAKDATPASALRSAQLAMLATCRRELDGDPLPAAWAGVVVEGRR